MPSRNYYVVLGVAADESDEGVRSAFRELVKRQHPDRTGPSGAAPFRELLDAYETLSDPEGRRRYDAELRRSRSSGTGLAREVSLRRDVVEVRASAEALSARLARNFSSAGVPKNEQVEELRVDVAISEEEAARGARLGIALPTFVRCPRCRGAGCLGCHGRGVHEYERPVSVDIPPLSGSGTTFVVPLSDLGIHNLYVRVRVRVDRSVAPPDASHGPARR